MRGALAIARRELGSAFGRPLAYAVLALYLALFAVLTLWFDDVLTGGVASVRGPLGWASALLALVVPAVTMRSFAEEAWPVVGTLPVPPLAIVVGKWLAAIALLGIALALTLPWPIAIAILGDPDPAPMVTGYLGLWLAASALAAVGVAASAWSDSQVVAFLVTLGAGGVPWLLARALPLVGARVAPLVEAFTVEGQLASLARGVVDVRALALFAAVVVVGLRLAVHALDRRRLG